LLVEAITGLILAEPGLVGQEKSPLPSVRQSNNNIQATNPETKTPTPQNQEQMPAGTKPAATGAFGIAKGIHQGKFGTLNLKWLVDLAAIGLIVLTLTGVYLSVFILKAQRKTR